MGVDDELRFNDCWNMLSRMRNKEVALLCADQALENMKGRSIAAVHGADKLGEIVWEYLNRNEVLGASWPRLTLPGFQTRAGTFPVSSPEDIWQ